jgi:hypothetical protein
MARTEVILTSSVIGMWGLSTSVTLQVEGFGPLSLTWNGTFYALVGNVAF